MEEVVKVNGDTSPTNGASGSSASCDVSRAASSSATAAKSVISINRHNVTIVSTDKDGGSRNSAKVTTTPLRGNQEPSMTGKGHVSEKIRDTQFVTALSQKFQQANGPLTVPTLSAGYVARSAPASISTSSRASVSHSRSSSSSGPGSLNNEDLTSKLSQMLQLQQQQQTQQQQIQQQRQSLRAEGRERQQDAADTSGSVSPSPPAPPPVLVNGGTTPNGSNGRGSSNSGASSPEIPPPPPSSALLRSISEQPALRKVPDASYTPKPKSYSTQSSLATGNENPPHNKHDLMASLTAVVTSGSPVAGLRKTRGPGKGGGVTEVYASKKTSSGTSSTSTTSAAASRRRKETN